MFHLKMTDFKESMKSLIKRQEELEKQILESLPAPIREADIHHMRYAHTKKRFGSLYPNFCKHILENFPDSFYVFLDRDARPISLTMSILNPDIPQKRVAFTREMLPEKLKSLMCQLQTDAIEEYFEETQELIEDYVERNRPRKSLLHQYLNQELSGLDNMLFVDTGYWGTCTKYMKEFFSNDSDYFLVFGPPGSNSYKHDVSEEGWTNIIENGIKHGFGIDGLKRGNKGIVVTTFEQPLEKRLQIPDYIAVEINALEFVHKEVSDEQIEKVLEKYL